MKFSKISKTQLAVILAGGYIFLQMTADIAATKVTYLGNLVMDAGFIYALTFTWRDLIHKQLGKKAAQTAIITAGVINIIMALYFQLVVALPAETEWAASGGQAAWSFIFGLVPRIVIASVIAEVVSELIDTEVYQLWVNKFKQKAQWMRVIASNSISIPVDSLIFPFVAFFGESWFSGQTFISMFKANLIVKLGITVLTFWMIYLLPKKPMYSE